MNITKNDTVTVNCQPELGQGIVRDIFKSADTPLRIIVSFGDDQSKLDYFFPCELTKVETGCPKCGKKSCNCDNSTSSNIEDLFRQKLKDLLEIPAQNLNGLQANLIVEMYKLLR